MIKPKATLDDLYKTLSYHKWKTGLELIAELEDVGKRASHFKGVIYIHLSGWEDQKLVKSRIRNYKHDLPRYEYLRISTGEPKKLFDIGGLEGSLVPA